MPPRQLIQNKKNKTMKRLKTCPGKPSSLQKNCRSNKNHAAFKKEIVCLKRNCSSLKLQLQEQKLENAALNRKYLNLEAEAQQLQLSNSALKEENRHYEKLISSTEPDIRACMTRMVETSQTLAGLQMAFNRHRSRQQLSKISGSLSKTQSRTHSSVPRSIVKHNKNVLNVAPRMKQAVRPMVQGLQIFTNLTIPLQRVSLPNQSSRSRIQGPDIEAPPESEVVNIAVEPERSSSVLFEKHSRNLHFRKNLKSKPKHFSVKKDESRRCKSNVKRRGSVRMVPEINFDENSSESEPEVKRFLKPIVLIRDFNVPSSKNGVRNALDKTFSVKTSSLQNTTSNQLGFDFQDPLEGTSSMFLCPDSSSKSKKSEKPPIQIRQNYTSDSDSDSESSCDMVEPVQQKPNVNSSLKNTDCKPNLVASPRNCLNEKQSSSPQIGVSINAVASVNCNRTIAIPELNSLENLNDVERHRSEPADAGSSCIEPANSEEDQRDIEMPPSSDV